MVQLLLSSNMVLLYEHLGPYILLDPLILQENPEIQSCMCDLPIFKSILGTSKTHL